LTAVTTITVASATETKSAAAVPQYFRFNQHFDLAIDFP